MRVDWFLPFLRKKKKGETLAPPSFVTRWAMTILPRSWFADRVAGKPGLARKLLKRIGPSALSSPLRRIVQAACFLLFLVLFFHVCWPYSARPAGDGQKSDGWRLLEVEQQTGLFRFEVDARPAWIECDEQVVHLTSSAGSVAYVGAFAIAETTSSGASLRPISELSPEAFDQLLLAQGTWSLGETEPNRWPAQRP